MQLQDVMHIGANVGKITLAARYGPELGEYMMHCHNNVHEDNDMFRAFMVSAAETPASRGCCINAPCMLGLHQGGRSLHTVPAADLSCLCTALANYSRTPQQSC